MNPSTTIIGLLSLTLLIVGTEAGFLQHKEHILVFNDLESRTDLTLHCKSGDNDLGVQHLTYRSDFEFHFRPNVQGSTLFYCSFQWDGALQYFDIYDHIRDYRICKRCLWNVRAKGPCMLNYTSSQYDICYPWNPQLP